MICSRSAQLRQRGLFRPEAVRGYIDEHRRGTRGLVDAAVAISDAGAMDADVPRWTGAHQFQGESLPSGRVGDRMKQVLQNARTR